MRKPFRGRPSRRQLISANNAAHSFYAAASERPDAQANLEKLIVTLPPKRERIRRPVGGRAADDLEGPVVAAVGELLSKHRQVLFAVRQNSGAMPWERDGRPVPVWFYKMIRWPERMTITDYWGFLKDARPFAIECKRPSWKEPTTDREQRQEAFLQMVKSIGGVSGFARSVEEALALLS